MNLSEEETDNLLANCKTRLENFGYGSPVLECAEFGRNVVTYDGIESDTDKIAGNKRDK